MTNEEWLENLDIGDALELFDALIYHIDGNFSELNLTYLAEETWKKLLNEYSNYGRRVYEEYASEIRGKEWRKIKDWSALDVSPLQNNHNDPKRSMPLGQNAVNNQSILVDPTKLNLSHQWILGLPGKHHHLVSQNTSEEALKERKYRSPLLHEFSKEKWLEKFDIATAVDFLEGALEICDEVIQHLDGRFKQLDLTDEEKEKWKKLIATYNSEGRRIYEEYGCEIATLDPAGPHTTFSPQSILEERLKGEECSRS